MAQTPSTAAPLLGTDVKLFAPVSITSPPILLLSAGQVNVADNGGSQVLDPTGITTRTFGLRRGKAGTNLCLFFAYAAAISTPPELQAFSRSRQGTDYANWIPCPTVDQNWSAVFAPAATDMTIGGVSYSMLKRDKWFDLMGQEDYMLGVKVAAAGTGAAGSQVYGIVL